MDFFFEKKKNFSICNSKSLLNEIEKKIDKTQTNGLFISPKPKNTILEMCLKSSKMSKLGHQMSRI